MYLGRVNSVICGLLSVALMVVGSISPSMAAATLQSSQGEVLVNRGRGFEGVGGAAALKPGDRVMVRPGGSATILYDNGCLQQVVAGQIQVVQVEFTCASGLTSSGATPYIIGAAVVGGAAALAIGLSGGNNKPASP